MLSRWKVRTKLYVLFGLEKSKCGKVNIYSPNDPKGLRSHFGKADSYSYF